MDFWLEEKSRSLNCRMRIVNHTDQVIPMYWWSNMAVPEYPFGQIIVPAATAYTCKNWEVYKVNVPEVDEIIFSIMNLFPIRSTISSTFHMNVPNILQM